MSFTFASLAGYDPGDPRITAAREDFDNLGNLILKLVARRKALGITQCDVARTMGTTQSAVSRLERTGGNPTVQTLQEYARAIGMRLNLDASPIDALRADLKASA
ncbi:MAG: helix-turn-helix transcriptional regulator [Bifidobacteriaceae bacterium]|jgi:transcriptional regulator with XRE-family HTH domain|nr:helix-turn-helix transcriptional regulator [Bifidobacteriaceae bacterium]